MALLLTEQRQFRNRFVRLSNGRELRYVDPRRFGVFRPFLGDAPEEWRLQGPDPLILVLSRGGFCPKERRQHEGLVQLFREMEVGYCRLVTLSTVEVR